MKRRLKEGSYITEAMLDAISPLYNFCITDPKSNNRVDVTCYKPSKLTFKDIDQIPSIGDIVFLFERSEIIKVKQITVSGGKVSISGYTGLSARWYTLGMIHPIKLNDSILEDLGFKEYKTYGQENLRRLILNGFLNLKLRIESQDERLDPMIYVSEGKPLIHYLHELQDILRVSDRSHVLKYGSIPQEIMVLTQSEYPINILLENNKNPKMWISNNPKK